MASPVPMPFPEAILDLQLKFLLLEFSVFSRRLHGLQYEPESPRRGFITEEIRQFERYQDQLNALYDIRDWLEERGGSYTMEGVLYEVCDGIVRMTMLDEVN